MNLALLTSRYQVSALLVCEFTLFRGVSVHLIEPDKTLASDKVAPILSDVSMKFTVTLQLTNRATCRDANIS